MKKSSTIPQAIVLAAGLGSRLKPLTDRIPKPALPVGGLPIILYNLMLLQEAGVRRVTINLYHRPEVLLKVLGHASKLKLDLQFSFEKKILGTAGGIAQALHKMEAKSTFVLNGDILCDIDLKTLWQRHQKSSAKASLLCVPPERAAAKKYLFYQRDHRLVDISEKAPSKKNIFQGVFAGVHILEPELFKAYPLGQFGCVIRQVYLPALHAGESFQVQPYHGAWWDLGEFSSLKSVDQKLWQENVSARLIYLRQKLFQIFPMLPF